MTKDITLQFLGHSAWLVTYDTYKFLIDPFITDNPVATVKAEELNPTHIILTHGHGDHLGDTVAIAKRTGAKVITNFEVANYLRDQGCDILADLSTGGGRNFDFGRVQLTIAHHGSAAPDGRYMGTATGVLLKLGGKTIYHSGDTGLFLDMKLIGEMHSIDVALLPIGDHYTMGIDEAVKAVEFLHPKITIPMHYNTFPPIEVDPEQFRSRVEAQGQKALILQPGETYHLVLEGLGTVNG